jgi:hypothetical protein
VKFRFTVRDLLWLTLVVGLCLGWLFTYQKYSRENRELRKTLFVKDHQYSAQFDLFGEERTRLRNSQKDLAEKLDAIEQGLYVPAPESGYLDD